MRPEKAINEGNLTFANIGSGLKDDLRGDFDKVLGFFGPVAGILQQIPFLGTIFNLLKRLTLKTLAYFLTAGKNFITSFKQRKKADKDSADFYKKQNKQNEKANRDKAKGVGASPAATAASGDPTDGQPQDDGEGGFVFQKASLFLVTAAAIGGPAGAALGGAAAGMTSFGKAAFAMGKALVIGGVALGIGLFIGIIQAATSINEQTLSFVPKLVVVLITFGLLANLMMVQLTDYFHFIFEQVTQVG